MSQKRDEMAEQLGHIKDWINGAPYNCYSYATKSVRWLVVQLEASLERENKLVEALEIAIDLTMKAEHAWEDADYEDRSKLREALTQYRESVKGNKW